MKLFGKKKETKSCCCGENCTSETMQNTENKKQEHDFVSFFFPNNFISYSLLLNKYRTKNIKEITYNDNTRRTNGNK